MSVQKFVCYHTKITDAAYNCMVVLHGSEMCVLCLFNVLFELYHGNESL